MSAPSLSVFFKYAIIEAAEGIPPISFTNGDYKPPIRKDQYTKLHTSPWLRRTMSEVEEVTTPPPATNDSYAVSVFYDEHLGRFLFHPVDCLATNISDLEHEHTERWGWRQLEFTHDQFDRNHTILDRNGEHAVLCGQPRSYSPELLPTRYRALDGENSCKLSGSIGLLIALTTFSCDTSNIRSAVLSRLNLQGRRWDNCFGRDWGTRR